MMEKISQLLLAPPFLFLLKKEVEDIQTLFALYPPSKISIISADYCSCVHYNSGCAIYSMTLNESIFITAYYAPNPGRSRAALVLCMALTLLHELRHIKMKLAHQSSELKTLSTWM